MKARRQSTVIAIGRVDAETNMRTRSSRRKEMDIEKSASSPTRKVVDNVARQSFLTRPLATDVGAAKSRRNASSIMRSRSAAYQTRDSARGKKTMRDPLRVDHDSFRVSVPFLLFLTLCQLLSLAAFSLHPPVKFLCIPLATRYNATPGRIVDRSHRALAPQRRRVDNTDT